MIVWFVKCISAKLYENKARSDKIEKPKIQAVCIRCKVGTHQRERERETFEHLGSNNVWIPRWVRYAFTVFSLLLFLFKLYTVGICNAFHE